MKLVLLVEHVSWMGDHTEYPEETPNPFVDVTVGGHITAERLQKFCDSYEEKIGWKIHILNILRIEPTGPMPGDTKELMCPKCKRKTDHQFVRTDGSAGFLRNVFEYFWQCMECEHEHPPVVFDQ